MSDAVDTSVGIATAPPRADVAPADRHRRTTVVAAGLWRMVRLLLVTVVVSTLIRAFLLAVFVIPSASMMPGLQVGDFFYATKWDHGWSSYSFSSRHVFDGRVLGSLPRRGEVVVFSGVRDPRTTYIKRVMGLPGDTVELRHGRVVLNGRELVQRFEGPFDFRVRPGVECLAIRGLIDLRLRLPDGSAGCRMLRFREWMPDGSSHDVLDFAVSRSDTFGPVVVPAGRMFLLGDNRDDSLDSRFPLAVGGLGMVPVDRIMGRARRIMFSTDGAVSRFRPWTMSGRLGFARAGPIE